jgi:hypothetical protein
MAGTWKAAPKADSSADLPAWYLVAATARTVDTLVSMVASTVA